MLRHILPKTLRIVWLLALLLAIPAGCAKDTAAAPFVPDADGTNYLEPAYRNFSEEEAAAASEAPPRANPWPSPSVPTWITRIGATWFLVDCYHNQIVYSDAPDALELPLTDWQLMTAEATQPHTIAGDGTVFLTDDTENNRVLVFARAGDGFLNTQTFWNIGERPHYTVYDETTDTFYVWSSLTGELYLFRRAADTTDVYETEVRRIERLRGIYIRSFTIDKDRIYFVSGVPSAERPDYRPAILCCDLRTLAVQKEYPVPDSLAGMTQLTPDPAGGWFVSVSTDIAGDQSAATLLHLKRLSDLEKGVFEDIYSRWFIGGGTPYYISRVGDDWFLTEHRLPGHAVWRFHTDRKGNVTDSTSLY